MKKFLKFGIFMALLFVFLLPAVFPVSGNPENDGNPSIKNVKETTVQESILSEEEKQKIKEAEEKDNAKATLYNKPLAETDLESTWVNIQDIETTENDQTEHSTFNPIAIEELKETATTNDPNKWVSINGEQDDKVKDTQKRPRADKPECDKPEMEKQQNLAYENLNENEMNKPNTTLVPEKKENLAFDFDKDDIKNMPAHPQKNKRPVSIDV